MANTINNFPSIQQMTEQISKSQEQRNRIQLQESGMSFEQILNNRTARSNVSELKFSKHANERLQSRNIDLSDAQLERLGTGVTKAFEKGIKESLVMVDNLAFIVNVNSNTVITAVNNMDDRVFTNIDGAVIA